MPDWSLAHGPRNKARSRRTWFMAIFSLRTALACGSTQRLNRSLGRFDAPLQFFIDQSHQSTEFSARRIDLFRVVHALRDDEFFKTRIGTMHSVKAVDVIACLQRKRFNASGFRRFGK
jgi:hypothetical protein